MNSRVKERIYFLVMLFCLLICVALIVSVLLGKPLATINRNVHYPAMRSLMLNAGAVSTAEGRILDESSLSDSVRLPITLSPEEVEVKIYSDGKMSLYMAVSKDACREYFDTMGFDWDIQHTIVMGMLPEVIDINLLMQVKSVEGGDMQINVLSVFVDDKDIDLSFFPDTFYIDIKDAVKTAIADQAEGYSYILFKEGSIILQ